MSLAKRYGADEKKAELAAIFHDYAKFRDKNEMKSIIQNQGMDPELLNYNSELWHAPVGAYLVQQEAEVSDSGDIRCDSLSYYWKTQYGLIRKNHLFS